MILESHDDASVIWTDTFRILRLSTNPLNAEIYQEVKKNIKESSRMSDT